MRDRIVEAWVEGRGDLDAETVGIFKTFYPALKLMFFYFFLLQIAGFIGWSFDINIDDEGALVEVGLRKSKTKF